MISVRSDLDTILLHLILLNPLPPGGPGNGLRLMLKGVCRSKEPKASVNTRRGSRIDDLGTKAPHEGVRRTFGSPSLFHMDEAGVEGTARGLPGSRKRAQDVRECPCLSGTDRDFWASISVTRQPRIWAAIRGSVKPRLALSLTSSTCTPIFGAISRRVQVPGH